MELEGHWPHVPASPEDNSALQVAPEANGQYVIPVPHVAPGSSSKRERFVMPDRRNTRLQVKTSPAKVDAMSSATASSSSAAPPAEPGLSQFDVDEDSDHGMGLSHCME